MPRSKNKKREPFSRPRGMRDISGDEFYKYQGFFEKASEIALYYGFRPIKTPMLEHKGVFVSGVGEETDIIGKEMYAVRARGGEKLALRPEGTAPIVRAYIEGGMHTLPQPVMFYYYGPFFRHDKPQRGRYREFFQFGLEVLGTQKSIADAMIIQITAIMLEEAGFKNLCVLINNIGDKDCRPRYMRELIAYYRKHVNSLCANCRQRLKTNPMRILDCKDEKCLPFKEEAPQSVSHLCEVCKQHLKEVLEYLDTMKIPYKIDHTLVRGLDYYTQTVFEIVNEEEPKEESKKEHGGASHGEGASGATEDKVEKEDNEKEAALLALAAGGRYDYLAKQLGSRRDVPGVGVAIGIDRVVELSPSYTLTPRIIKKPKVYFIQIGFDAKLKSLAVIEVLRKTHVPIIHSLSKDKLSAQLGSAEKMGIPYVIILGQREALEDTVIVRDMNTRSQDTVKVEKLADYLKKKI